MITVRSFSLIISLTAFVFSISVFLYVRDAGKKWELLVDAYTKMADTYDQAANEWESKLRSDKFTDKQQWAKSPLGRPLLMVWVVENRNTARRIRAVLPGGEKFVPETPENIEKGIEEHKEKSNPFREDIGKLKVEHRTDGPVLITEGGVEIRFTGEMLEQARKLPLGSYRIKIDGIIKNRSGNSITVGDGKLTVLNNGA